MAEQVKNHEEYIKELSKTAEIYNKIFKYDKGQVYYKNNIITGFRYWWWRVLILLACLCCGILPGLIPLCMLFANRKPWNKFLLKDDEGVGFLEKGNQLMYPTKKMYLKKDEIEFINTNEKDNLIGVYKKKRNGGYKRAFIFSDIYQFDKLIGELKKQGYMIKSDEKSKTWHWYRENTASVIVWSIFFLLLIGVSIMKFLYPKTIS